MKNINYTIEKTEKKGIELLTIGENKYLIGESISEIFILFIKDASVNDIVQYMNKNTNSSNKFTEDLILSTIEDKIKPIIEKGTKVKSSVKKIFKILNPSKYENLLSKLTFLFTPIFFYSVLIFTTILNGFFYFKQAAPKNDYKSFTDYIYIVAGIIIIVLLHEIGHSIASIHFKIKPKEIGFGLYFIFPSLYTDLTEIWKLKNNSRIIINCAGIYFQLIVNTFLIILFYLNVFNEYIMYAIIISSQVICIFNLNPFFKFDGYWIYSDFFDIPNLRKQTLNLYKEFIKKQTLKNRKASLLIYSFLYFVFMSYILYKLLIFILTQLNFIYSNINNISDITVTRWALFALSVIASYIIINRFLIIYNTYFNETKID